MSKLAGILIGVVLAGMIVTAFISFIDGFSENYNIEDEVGWEENFTFKKEVTNLTRDITNILEDENTNWVVSGLRLGYSVVKIILKMPEIIKNFFSEVGTRLNLPEWVGDYIFLIIIIIIVFIIAAALVRWYI